MNGFRQENQYQLSARRANPGGGMMTTQELTYVEKLKDPRWQKKRLEVLERDA